MLLYYTVMDRFCVCMHLTRLAGYLIVALLWLQALIKMSDRSNVLGHLTGTPLVLLLLIRVELLVEQKIRKEQENFISAAFECMLF